MRRRLSALRRVLVKDGTFTSETMTFRAIRLLERHGVLTDPIAELIRDLRSLRNDAAHASDFGLSTASAMEYFQLAAQSRGLSRWPRREPKEKDGGRSLNSRPRSVARQDRSNSADLLFLRRRFSSFTCRFGPMRASLLTVIKVAIRIKTLRSPMRGVRCVTRGAASSSQNSEKTSRAKELRIFLSRFLKRSKTNHDIGELIDVLRSCLSTNEFLCIVFHQRKLSRDDRSSYPGTG